MSSSTKKIRHHIFSDFQKAVQARAFFLRFLRQVSCTGWHHALIQVSEVGNMINGISVHFERRLRLAVDGHIICFRCGDNKAKTCRGGCGYGELRLGPQD